MRKMTTKAKSKTIKSPRLGTKPPVGIQMKDILVPIDFSEASRLALAQAKTFAENFGARLTLLYVVEPPVYPEIIYSQIILENDKIAGAAQQQLDRLPAQCHVPDELIRQKLVRTGSAHYEITEAARTLKMDLIIISTHGYTGVKHMLLGSTTERVVRHAPCPVLVLRHS